MNYTEEPTHISNIRNGDTIIHNDKITTVSDSDIKISEFMGISLFGDNYHCGNKKVRKIIINKELINKN